MIVNFMTSVTADFVSIVSLVLIFTCIKAAMSSFSRIITRNQRGLKLPSYFFFPSSSTLEEFALYSRSISTWFFFGVICYSWREENFGMRGVRQLAEIQNRFLLNGRK